MRPSYGDVVGRYRMHPEPKSSDANGKPCAGETRGLLHRQLVMVRTLTHVGKESNLLEEAEAGLVHAQEEVRSEYSDRRRDAWSTLVWPS
jgi:hypothetical protein